MSNFSFLKEKGIYRGFAPACIEAEEVYPVSPSLSIAGCRKGLELAVKWVYAVDETMDMPEDTRLYSLMDNSSFKDALEEETWERMNKLRKLGNSSVHSRTKLEEKAAVTALKTLFEFVQWIDYCYGEDYEERFFDEALIPEKSEVDVASIEAELQGKDERIEALEKELRKLSALSEELTAKKEKHQEERTFHPQDFSEFETRKVFIDVDLASMGWTFSGPSADVVEEFPVENMAGVLGKRGFADYVLFGSDGRPLAVVEAKHTTKDPNVGRRQACLYADALEEKFGRRPMMFTTNGFETYFWDDLTSAQRRVSGIFSKADLEKLMVRRTQKKPLLEIPIDDAITDRYYQKEGIRAVCDAMEEGFRKHLLVMATGTGKTRTAASLTDVLSRGGWITNVLFLADRTALVKQAKEDFKRYLPDMSLCNLCETKDNRTARIVFSTYPTMLNAIDDAKTADGTPLFTPAHFDLIIIDESHRSIFKKYRAIFEYFDAHLVGLTATPKTDVDRNTYDFFEMDHGIPTYAYDYETAVGTDHVLVPYYNYEVKTKFLEEGIRHDDLCAEDQERYEEDFIEDGGLPEEISSAELNRFVFNELTVDTVLQDLMERGIKICGGDQLGKTIIFAQNKRHAEFIVSRFNALYPQFKGLFAQRIVCEDAYAQSLIDDFKQESKNPFIAVSVDMMDTGIDVPECVNLVFFKKVRSKAKFWQMIGRGTRLCPDLEVVDQIDGAYTDKRRFLIFDYCGNFEYFRQHKEGYEAKETKSLSELLFGKRVRLIRALESGAYSGEGAQEFRLDLIDTCHRQVLALNRDLFAVKSRRQWVEQYREKEAFSSLSESAVSDLLQQVAPLVTDEEQDEGAKRFDNLMFSLMLGGLEGLGGVKASRSQVVKIATELQKKGNTPQVKAKLPLLKDICSDGFLQEADLLTLERVRQELRGLMSLLEEGGRGRRIVITRLTDTVMDRQEGQQLEAAYDFEDYRAKVNHYVNAHMDTLAIYKLTHNIPLEKGDMKELERVFTEELGSREDYQREFGNTPFGLLIRRIAKLDRDAAMEAFSSFINDASLNSRQIAFVHKIINHIVLNGYMESVGDLAKPPFDKPDSFIRLFDTTKRQALKDIIVSIRENALVELA